MQTYVSHQAKVLLAMNSLFCDVNPPRRQRSKLYLFSDLGFDPKLKFQELSDFFAILNLFKPDNLQSYLPMRLCCFVNKESQLGTSQFLMQHSRPRAPFTSLCQRGLKFWGREGDSFSSPFAFLSQRGFALRSTLTKKSLSSLAILHIW